MPDPFGVVRTFIADSPRGAALSPQYFFLCQEWSDRTSSMTFHGANALQVDPTPGCRLSKTIEAFIHFSDAKCDTSETYLEIKGT